MSDRASQQLAACAHDLRSALTVISGYAALLGRDDLPAGRRSEAVAGIEAAVARASALVGEALSGQAREAGGERLLLAPVARQAAADVRASAGREVVLVLDSEVAVNADELGIARVLENLLGNAAKYAPEGDIKLRVAREGDLAVIEVSDRGPGIPDAHRKSVFEPFARLDRDEKVQGTGLGLTVVRGVAEAGGGDVAVLSREGGGATFRLTFPVA